MQSKRHCFIAVAFTAVFGVLASLSLAGKPDSDTTSLEYDIHQLDSAGGMFNGSACDLNDLGMAVGSAVENATGDSFAACWDLAVAEDGTVTTNLRLLPNTNSTRVRATGVNNLGEVVGDEEFSIGLYWPSVTEPPLLLPPLPGDTDSTPYGINDAGVICGVSSYGSTSAGVHPVVWRVIRDNDWNPVVLGPFSLPGVNGIAWDLSELDEDEIVTVAGTIWDDESAAGVTWQVVPQSEGSVSIDPEPTILQINVSVRGINNTGVAAGYSPEFNWIAMLWTETERTSLQLPRQYASSGAWDLNDSGIVVGWLSGQESGFPPGEAAVWAGSQEKPVLLSSFLDRKSPFDYLTVAPAINSCGMIVGIGGGDGSQQAFIALPK